MLVQVFIGANYGDEGKGRVASEVCKLWNGFKIRTMYPCLPENSKTLKASVDIGCIGVLTNGGPQRGHSEAACTYSWQPAPPRLHVYRHWSVCSPYKAFTYMCKDFLVYPVLLDWERIRLGKRFFTKPEGTTTYELKCGCDPMCKFITMYDIWLNQLTEINRGSQRHGSVGMGIWETLLRYQRGPYRYMFELLTEPVKVVQKLLADIRAYFWESIKERGLSIPKDYEDILTEKALDTQDELFITAVKSMKSYTYLLEPGELLSGARIAGIENIYCENGQGLLLDQSLGDKYQTPSTTGATAANAILEHMTREDTVALHYVTRSLTTPFNQ